MPYKDTLAEVDCKFQRDSAFSYQCNACSRCCHNKAIRVGAYEILRLARRLGITTTEFIERHTAGRIHLAQCSASFANGGAPNYL